MSWRKRDNEGCTRLQNELSRIYTRYLVASGASLVPPRSEARYPGKIPGSAWRLPEVPPTPGAPSPPSVTADDHYMTLLWGCFTGIGTIS